jgi:hypothetical protein
MAKAQDNRMGEGVRQPDMTRVVFDHESYYRISDCDAMRPFFMSIVSDSNHWMFIASNGGLTAGRKNAENALFPYTTDDKITDSADFTGCKTICQVHSTAGIQMWEPFSDRFADRYRITRNLYKSVLGNKIVFEEVNHDLQLTFRYQWCSGHQYGFIRNAALTNHAEHACDIRILDGIQNILPAGLNSYLQMATSNLADAYKRHELVKAVGLAIYALSAIIADKAEPSEALRANAVWSFGMQNPTHLLSSLQLAKFRKGHPVVEESDIKGEKGAYFISSRLRIPGKETTQWSIVANINLDIAAITSLRHLIRDNPDPSQLIQRDIDMGTQNLLKLVASADGLQCTADSIKDSRHYSNVLFNIMRGGIFHNNYLIGKNDFFNYLRNSNRKLTAAHRDFHHSLPQRFTHKELENLSAKTGDPDLQRLCVEYLPLKFSRRHGDPSRPWNQFNINTINETDGSELLDYEGNWRDIFQNWEALLYSYPDFAKSMIYKFLNATTFDGYNPYRLTKGGFDWEIIEPDNPWSYIGYWGDHQIIYLLKLLEFQSAYTGETTEWLSDKELFVYANVPYRIKPYQDIVKDPKNTINFDKDADRKIREAVEKSGADEALLKDVSGEIYRVTFIEKILAIVLAKVSNFVPEAGIWMNTQRPEWNDANNALVGNGASMVTLYHLYRFLKFFSKTFTGADTGKLAVSAELAEFFHRIHQVLDASQGMLAGDVSDADRKFITDALGTAAGEYREAIYLGSFSGKSVLLERSSVSEWINLTIKYLEHSIRKNQRKDGLYHAYNLVKADTEGIRVSHLSEMLEGQVAVISSGYLNPEETLKVLVALRKSVLYREDQHSYILYPNKNLPGFLERNNILRELAEGSELLVKMVQENNTAIINRDMDGNYHFNGNFTNAGDLKAALEALKNTCYQSLVEEEASYILDVFEEVFDHKSFTGRSGTFFAYEGLGSIYWHMVSKLHLAVQEVILRAVDENFEPEVTHKLMALYDEIGEGIGIHKSPLVYGAFPTDPYSHTPLHRGAQQPGMTGQVKEDILVRIGELGIRIVNGTLLFSPSLLRREEFLQQATPFRYFNTAGESLEIHLAPGTLGFTFCLTPVICHLSDSYKTEVLLSDGQRISNDTLSLDQAISKEIFERTGRVSRIDVFISKKLLR